LAFVQKRLAGNHCALRDEVLTADFFHFEKHDGVRVLRLRSDDGTNRLTRACVLALTKGFRDLAHKLQPLIVTGNRRFFSAGADLSEIVALTGPEAYEFSRLGQALMTAIESFPAPVYAAVSGYCMGGGLDLALACHRRIASPHAVLGHRGAALGLITGWGGTQRLPRLVGKAKALEMLVAAEKLHASDALRYGLIDTVAEDPVAEAARRLISLPAIWA
jgi:enoyl-CoA hydratase/carnithine racemase